MQGSGRAGRTFMAVTQPVGAAYLALEPIPQLVRPVAMPAVNLFVPCYIDQAYPQVGMAATTVLRRAGCEVRFDPRQTCCGQPMANSGCARDAARLARRHLDVFRGGVTVVPSGSCAAMVRLHYDGLLPLDDEDRRTIARTYELGEFLVGQLGIEDVGARFPYRVALHHSCHGLRELRLGGSSEIAGGCDMPGAAERLLRRVAGLTLLLPQRRDECCGFGGTFAVAEAGLSVRMGEGRCDQLAAGDAEWMTGTDVSCLMHLGGVAARRPAGGPKPIHLAEILAAA
jgi:L-lactate dehydrogenase complex protein LldE